MVKTIASHNPARPSQRIVEVEAASPRQIEAAVAAARRAASAWRLVPLERRLSLLAQLPQKLRQHAELISRAISLEMGKPLAEAREEIEDAAIECAYLLSRGEAVLGNQCIGKEADAVHCLSWHAIGVVAVIAPWNYPVELAVWGILSALIAGNGVVYKPSETTPHVGQLLAAVFHELDLPEMLFSLIQGDREEGQLLTESAVDAIWFVGSTEAGIDIYRRAAGGLKKCLLELGGSSPAIVFDDVPLDDALTSSLISGRFTNCGQVCSAIKRLYVQEAAYAELVDRLFAAMETLRIGDPFDPSTRLGPVATRHGWQRLELQLANAMQAGAVAYRSTQHIDSEGYFFRPTLLTGVSQTMAVMQEEVFGPILPIHRFRDESELLALANDSRYGLSAVIYSGKQDRAERIARELDAGRVLVNTAKSPGIAYPVEGFKQSGLGRHQGDWLLRELAVMKYCKFGRLVEQVAQ